MQAQTAGIGQLKRRDLVAAEPGEQHHRQASIDQAHVLSVCVQTSAAGHAGPVFIAHEGGPSAARLLRRRLSRESDRLLSLSLRELRSRERSRSTSFSLFLSFSLSFFL